MKKRRNFYGLLFLLVYSLIGMAGTLTLEQPMNMTLTSSAFSEKGAIPMRYSCEASERSPDLDLSPALSWSHIPPEAKSLVLIVLDPDAPDPKAPKMTWTHWVLYNLPVNSPGLPEKVSSSQLPKGTLMGLNSWNKVGYGGPCPPIGEHRYFFTLYALNAELPDLNQPHLDALKAAMQGKVIAKAELMGTYIKQK